MNISYTCHDEKLYPKSRTLRMSYVFSAACKNVTIFLFEFSYKTHVGQNIIEVSWTTSIINSLSIVYSTIFSGAHQRKHQSFASLAFVWGIYRGAVNSPHKWPITRKMFPSWCNKTKTKKIMYIFHSICCRENDFCNSLRIIHCWLQGCIFACYLWCSYPPLSKNADVDDNHEYRKLDETTGMHVTHSMISEEAHMKPLWTPTSLSVWRISKWRWIC